MNAARRVRGVGQTDRHMTMFGAYMISSADPLYVFRLKCIDASV